MRYKITDIDNESFYQLPKSLFTQKNYKGLSSDAKIIYALLKDRMCLSRKNGWKDSNGDIYLIFKQETIGELLSLSTSSVSRAITDLKKYQLIEVVRQGYNRPNKIYIKKVELEDEEMPPVLENSTPKEEVCAEKPSNSANDKDLQICKSGLAPAGIQTCKYANPDLHPWESGLAPVQPNDTNINNTELSETEKNYTDNNNNKKSVNFTEKEVREVVVVLNHIGMDPALTEILLEEYGAQAVKRQLYHLSLACKNGEVSNRIGWLCAALKGEYRLNKGTFSMTAPDSPKTLDGGRTFVAPLAEESIQLANEIPVEYDAASLFASFGPLARNRE